MVTAVETRPDTNPDRASFTTALQAARDQLVTAARDLPRRRPARPPRCHRPRRSEHPAATTPSPLERPKVKNATSRYLNRDDGRPATSDHHHRDRHRPAHTHRRCVLAPPASQADQPTPAPTRRDRVTALMQGDPREPGAAANWPTTSVSNPATCSPNSPNGPAWASSPARTPAPTPSRPAATPRVLDQPALPLTTRHCVAQRSRSDP